MIEEEENLTEEPKRKKKISSVIALLFFIIMILTSGFLIYNIFLLSGIENNIRYIVIGFIGLIDFICLIKMIKIWKNKPPKNKKKKESKRIGFITFLLLYSIICGSVGYLIFYLYGTVNNINKKYTTYSSSLIVLKDNKASKITSIKDYKIGILKDKSSPEGYIIPEEIIKSNKLEDNNKIVKYESYTEMISDLYSGDVDAIFLTSDYSTVYSSISGYENIGTETKVITKKEKRLLKSSTSKTETESTGKSVTEPFTMLLLGVDSTSEKLEKNTAANGDSIMLITFNPKTLNVTMLSIPRDTYVPIACWSSKDKNKITHAAAYGTDCMVNTIEDYFDINIDYYSKINFKGLVNLVNALGGIDVNVPQDLCTDDSNRDKEVCIKKGQQHLNGEEALVLSRDRKQLVNGDFGRGQNQQLVIEAMLEKIKSIKSIGEFTKVLNTISNSLDTNLTTKQILSFYSVAKDIVKSGISSDKSNIVSIQQLYLYGQSAMLYDKRMKMTLYDYVPNTYSRNDIVKAMKENLALADHTTTKTFSFSINNPYEKTVIGQGPYKSTYSESDDDDSDSCSTNEELGADKKTCVCKSGYTKINGKCTKEEESTTSTKYGCTDKNASNYNSNATDDDNSCTCNSGYKKVNGTCTKIECGTNEELGADNTTCVCKSGFEKVNGNCVEKCGDNETRLNDGTCSSGE